MKVLILSVSAGGGHVHAAEAIKDYINLKNKNAETKIIDTLKYINPIIDKVIVGSYLKTIKVSPSLYGKLYTHSEGEDTFASTISAKFNEIMTYKLVPLIDEFSPDILVCTHPFPTEMISIMKTKYNLTIPCISIITDYYPHTSWLHPYVDAYVVSNSDMIDDMVSKGIQRTSIYNLGIPVKPSFNEVFDREITLKELGLDSTKPTILIMGGSLGMGNISEIYKNLGKINLDFQIIVITGNNKKLFSELVTLKKFSIKETRIIGFTETVNKYMQACDLLLTKPGGLTITEALICKVPLGLFSPIPGQEEKNAEFLLKHNLATNLFDISHCKETIENLLSSNENLKTMRDNSFKFSKPCSGTDICNLIDSLIQNNNIRNKIKSLDEDIEKHSSTKTFFKSVEEYFMKTAAIFLGSRT